MKTIITVEKASNGFIVSGEETGVKKVTVSEEAASKMLANDFVPLFENMKDGDVRTIEIKVK